MAWHFFITINENNVSLKAIFNESEHDPKSKYKFPVEL